LKDNEREESSSHSKITKSDNDYSTTESKDLSIPPVPEPPKNKQKMIIENPDVLKRMRKIESPDRKVVLVNCERCNAVIPIPVLKKIVIESILPIVPISYVHKNLEKKDQHCITIHLDHDFDIRRQRLSDVVLSSD